MSRICRMVGGAFVLGLLILASASPRAVAAEEPELVFVESSEAWNLVFRHHHGGSGRRYMVETVVGGVVFFDYDDDGDLDVYMVDGAALPGYEGEAIPGSRLFRNDLVRGERGNTPRFVDVTERAGLGWDGYGSGAVAGDYDGDGDLDLYVTAFGANRLWRNRGDGTFEDATATAGVGDLRWSCGAALADLDADGDLDLYVANYVDFGLDNHKTCRGPDTDIETYCNPDSFLGVHDILYLNRGDGTFEDITEAAGLGSANHAGLGAVIADFDDDGRPDIYVANDAEPNFLFRNLGTGDDGLPRFEDISLLSGTAYSDKGRAEGGMGVAIGDIDADGLNDIVVTNFELETNAHYRGLGSALFADVRFPSRVAESSFAKVGFGVALADFDLDADLDLMVANGHVLDNVQLFAEHKRYEQPNQLFRNNGAGRYALATVSGLDIVRSSRGLAAGDLDLDGDLDVVIVNSNDLAEVWENRSVAIGDWLQIDLVERSGRDRDAVGARVALTTGERRQIQQRATGASYISQNAMTTHFGIVGNDAPVLDVRWPDGAETRIIGLEPGTRVRMVRP